MTSDGPDYRANPAHLAEQVAIPIVGEWLGEKGSLLDASASNARFDFTIEYGDDRCAVGDVWLDADERLMATWSDLFDQSVHHEIPLRPGAGLWSLGLAHEAKSKVVRRELPTLVDDALAIGQTDLEFEHGWIPPEADQAIRSVYAQGQGLSITYLTRHDPAGRDVAIWFPMSSPKAQAADPGTLREWLHQVFASPAGKKHIKKLLAANADERHAFVVANTATPVSVQTTLSTLSGTEPGLVVPHGITHVWVLPRSINLPAGSWTRSGGWQVIRH